MKLAAPAMLAAMASHTPADIKTSAPASDDGRQQAIASDRKLS
jgi:hypothetical protein